MRHRVWAFVLAGALSACASSSDTKVQRTAVDNTPPSEPTEANPPQPGSAQAGVLDSLQDNGELDALFASDEVDRETLGELVGDDEGATNMGRLDSSGSGLGGGPDVDGVGTGGHGQRGFGTRSRTRVTVPINAPQFSGPGTINEAQVQDEVTRRDLLFRRCVGDDGSQGVTRYSAVMQVDLTTRKMGVKPIRSNLAPDAETCVIQGLKLMRYPATTGGGVVFTVDMAFEVKLETQDP